MKCSLICTVTFKTRKRCFFIRSVCEIWPDFEGIFDNIEGKLSAKSLQTASACFWWRLWLLMLELAARQWAEVCSSQMDLQWVWAKLSQALQTKRGNDGWLEVKQQQQLVRTACKDGTGEDVFLPKGRKEKPNHSGLCIFWMKCVFQWVNQEIKLVSILLKTETWRLLAREKGVRVFHLLTLSKLVLFT